MGTVPERLDLTVEDFFAVDFKSIGHTRVYFLYIVGCIGGVSAYPKQVSSEGDG